MSWRATCRWRATRVGQPRPARPSFCSPAAALRARPIPARSRLIQDRAGPDCPARIRRAIYYGTRRRSGQDPLSIPPPAPTTARSDGGGAQARLGQCAPSAPARQRRGAAAACQVVRADARRAGWADRRGGQEKAGGQEQAGGKDENNLIFLKDSAILNHFWNDSLAYCGLFQMGDHNPRNRIAKILTRLERLHQGYRPRPLPLAQWPSRFGAPCGRGSPPS